eukprot:scaffold57386_cov66-Cyclotella_meneghiniana.AAC.6
MREGIFTTRRCDTALSSGRFSSVGKYGYGGIGHFIHEWHTIGDWQREVEQLSVVCIIDDNNYGMARMALPAILFPVFKAMKIDLDLAVKGLEVQLLNPNATSMRNTVMMLGINSGRKF